MISISILTVGMLMTNCYIVYDDEVMEALIVDPGDNPKSIERALDNLNLKPIAILLTHAHGDHIGAVPRLRNDYDLPIFVHEADKEMLANGRMNLMGLNIELGPRDVLLHDGDELHLGGLDFKVIHTPGHTPGGCCFYFKDADVLLAGDTMFYHSWGRTDFPGGDEFALMSSIRNKLLPLPPETVVYPGHDMMTTIGAERMVHGYRE